jgi:hypothetical protein
MDVLLKGGRQQQAIAAIHEDCIIAAGPVDVGIACKQVQELAVIVTRLVRDDDVSEARSGQQRHPDWVRNEGLEFPWAVPVRQPVVV